METFLSMFITPDRIGRIIVVDGDPAQYVTQVQGGGPASYSTQQRAKWHTAMRNRGVDVVLTSYKLQSGKVWVQRGADTLIAARVALHASLGDPVCILTGDGDFEYALAQVRESAQSEMWVVGVNSSFSYTLRALSNIGVTVRTVQLADAMALCEIPSSSPPYSGASGSTTHPPDIAAPTPHPQTALPSSVPHQPAHGWLSGQPPQHAPVGPSSQMWPPLCGAPCGATTATPLRAADTPPVPAQPQPTEGVPRRPLIPLRPRSHAVAAAAATEPAQHA
jgi:hypothetical protein